jgi:tripartite-type tricarboxylate transporter receptor subunit TctC
MLAKGIFLSVIAAIGLGLAGVHPAAGQSYPSRQIKIVVPYPPGGPSDVAARLVAQPLAAKLGQTVIIENLPGAGGRTGAKAVAQASPDGYTLLLGGTNPNAIAQSIYNSLTFEPIRDFTAVGVIGVDSNALVVNPAVPVNTIRSSSTRRQIRENCRPTPRSASVRM